MSDYIKLNNLSGNLIAFWYKRHCLKMRSLWKKDKKSFFGILAIAIAILLFTYYKALNPSKGEAWQLILLFPLMFILIDLIKTIYRFSQKVYKIRNEGFYIKSIVGRTPTFKPGQYLLYKTHYEGVYLLYFPLSLGYYQNFYFYCVPEEQLVEFFNYSEKIEEVNEISDRNPLTMNIEKRWRDKD
jgi:hypothetical protein